MKSVEISQAQNLNNLKLVAKNSKQAWFKVNTPITGDYTVQFDYRNTDGNMDRWMYVTLWQDSDVYGFVQMRGDNFRFQYKDKDGVNTNSDTFYAYDAAVWNTMKIARVNGAVYVNFFAVAVVMHSACLKLAFTPGAEGAWPRRCTYLFP